MAKVVVLRKAGNSKVLTVPADLAAGIGTRYQVDVRSDGTLIFQPLQHQNVFASPEWRNYAYQQDRLTDPELQSLKPVGKEKLDS